MKITQIMLSKGFGGGERLFVDMCLSLFESGHSVQAICHSEFEGRAFLSHNQIQVVGLNVHWDYSILARYRLKKEIYRFKPDIIHTHMARASIVGGSVGKKMSIPVVANLHNYVNMKYYHDINHFFPGTEDQKKYLLKNMKNENDITVIPHFSRIPVVKITENQENTTYTILSYGRFVHKKGFNILIQSIGILKDRGIDINLILGGDGPEKDNLEKLVTELKLNKNVLFSGWVKDIPEFLSQSPFFILPSLEEPFGIVVLEAMSQGKTIITTKTPGPLEVFDDTTAYLVPIGDPQELANLIFYALLHKKESHEKAEKAHRKYINCYAPDKIIPIFESAYRKIIQKHKL